MASILPDALCNPQILPLLHVKKQQHRDDKLWVREEQRARLYNLKCLHCPCTKCKGHFLYTIGNVRGHLIHNERDLRFRIWIGPCTRDLLDEEWEEEFKRPIKQQTQLLNSAIGMQVMVVDAF